MTPLDYSVVIAIDRTDKGIPSLESLLRLSPSEQPSEIFVCVGRNPSLQRNAGARLCKSPLVYFIDDDSRVIEGTPRHLASHFEEGRTAVAGGPNLPPPDATGLENTISAVLASWLGSFSVRTRYASLGSVKEATEKDLILCNMMIHREVFLREKGFRTDLFPNEENEFLNRLLHAGYRLVYDPSAAIYRPRRKSWGDFCHQAFRYGRGRAQQIKVYPCLSDLVHLIPTLFLLYVLSFLVLPFLSLPVWPGPVNLLPMLWLSPLAIFLLLAGATGVSVTSWFRDWSDVLKVPFLIFLRHLSYGWGFILGFFTSIPRPSIRVELHKVRWKGKKYRLSPVRQANRRRGGNI